MWEPERRPRGQVEYRYATMASAPRRFYLQHRFLTCGYSVQQCTRWCGFCLPTEFCQEDDFKQHLLYQHSSFRGFKFLLREGKNTGLAPLLDNTDLTVERLAGLQLEVYKLCKAGEGPPSRLYDCYGYLEACRVETGETCYVCYRCTFAAARLEDVKRHLVYQHVKVVKSLPPPPDMAEMFSTRELAPVRMTTPRQMPS